MRHAHLSVFLHPAIPKACTPKFAWPSDWTASLRDDSVSIGTRQWVYRTVPASTYIPRHSHTHRVHNLRPSTLHLLGSSVIPLPYRGMYWHVAVYPLPEPHSP